MATTKKFVFKVLTIASSLLALVFLSISIFQSIQIKENSSIDTIPNFVLTRPNGHSFNILDTYKQKYCVIINLSLDCGSCQEYLSLLKSKKQFSEREDIQFICVFHDKKSSQIFSESFKFKNFISTYCDSRYFFEKFRSTSTPLTFIYNDGQLLTTYSGIQSPEKFLQSE